jgi:uncharacterized membrane protein YphA (DoxX/SURF4 family)
VFRNVRQIGFFACFLLVLLRVAIGWQFLYEGIWKLDTQKTSKPWSAEGYLVNARGPLRDKFRGMVDDPNGLDKLDYKKVVAGWDSWRDRFLAKWSDVPDLKAKIDEVLDGPGEFAQPLDRLPAGVDLKAFKIPKDPPKSYLRYNAKERQLETNLHLLPNELESLLAMGKKPAPAADAGEVPDGDAAEDAVPSKDKKPVDAALKKWRDAVNALYKKTGKLSLKERLSVLLESDPERNGVVLEAHAGTIDHERPGKKQIYLHLLERYEKDLKDARQTFQREHLDSQWRKIFERKTELVGPVDALTAEFHTSAYRLLKENEPQRGPVPELPSKIHQINQLTMWSLAIVGVMLMLGLFSRLSALGAAGLLLLFYLPMPPWPGVPEPPGPEHSLYINKNLIEFFACLALVGLPTGRWLGLDALIRRFILRKKTD